MQLTRAKYFQMRILLTITCTFLTILSLSTAMEHPPLRTVSLKDLLNRYHIETTNSSCDTVIERQTGTKFVMKRSLFSKRGEREAEWLSRLYHVNIVNLYDEFMCDHEHVMLLEHVGSSLEQVKNGTGIPSDKIVSISKQLFSVLQYLELEGVVHCNINPKTVFLTSDWQVKLCGFHKAVPVGTVLPAQPETLFTAAECTRFEWVADCRADVYSVARVIEYLGLESNHLPISTILLDCLSTDPNNRPFSSEMFAQSAKL